MNVLNVCFEAALGEVKLLPKSLFALNCIYKFNIHIGFKSIQPKYLLKHTKYIAHIT